MKEEKQAYKLEPDVEIIVYPVNRALHEIAYLIRFLWFKLTEIDLLLSTGVAVLLLAIIFYTGTSKATIFGICRVDPWLWMGGAILTATIISIFHKQRPEGDIDKIIRDFVSQKRLFLSTAPIRDRHWFPSSLYRN